MRDPGELPGCAATSVGMDQMICCLCVQGQYTLTINLLDEEKPLGCVEVNVTIVSGAQSRGT